MFIVYDLPYLINTSPAAIAHLLRYEMDEVVFVPNVTTGVNVVLRDLEFGEGDVVLYFSTIGPACEKTVMSLEEMDIIKGVKIEIEF
jgi:selenocysteine lyase/cysteine desulfurase